MIKVMRVIPAGYRIIVTTWENDGDNYNTKTLSGISLDETKFLVEYLEAHGNFHRNSSNWGNMYDPSQQDIDSYLVDMQLILDRYPAVKKAMEDRMRSGETATADCISEFYGYDLGVTCGEFFTRVVDDFTIEYIPSPITIEDVTAQFTKSGE